MSVLRTRVREGRLVWMGSTITIATVQSASPGHIARGVSVLPGRETRESEERGVWGRGRSTCYCPQGFSGTYCKRRWVSWRGGGAPGRVSTITRLGGFSGAQCLRWPPCRVGDGEYLELLGGWKEEERFRKGEWESSMSNLSFSFVFAVSGLTEIKNKWRTVSK